MTPQAIFNKYIVDAGNTDFLSELAADYLWAFLDDSIAWDEPDLVKAVIFEIRAEHAADADIWLNTLGGVLPIREKRDKWLRFLRNGYRLPESMEREMIELIGDL